MELISESPTIRLLRGGSGGGGKGGSGGYSGGSFSGGSRGNYGTSGRILPIWFYSSHSTNGSGEPDQIASWVWIAIVVLIAFCCLCCCYYREFGRKSDNCGAIGTQVDVDKDPDFETAVLEARRNIAYTSSPHSACDVRYQTYGGTFDSKYSDRGETLAATLNLRLANDGLSGYTIEGEGRDNDGITKVTDGFITYNGNAWWLEETFSGRDAGLKVLTKGTFDFSNNTFSGTWRSSSKYEGNYVSFVGRDITKTFDSSHGDEDIPVVIAEAEESIPVVFAMEESVSAVPQATAYNGVI